MSTGEVIAVVAVVGLVLAALVAGYFLGRPETAQDARDAAEAERARAEREARQRTDGEAWDEFLDKFGR